MISTYFAFRYFGSVASAAGKSFFCVLGGRMVSPRKNSARVGSPGTNLAGSLNLAGCLPHELVLNLGKVESNMAGIL